MLYKRKPVSGDEKAVREVVGEEGRGEVEFSVMVIGGVGGGVGGAGVKGGAEGEGVKGSEGEGEKVGEKEKEVGGEGKKIEEVLGQDAFWADLQTWVGQRVGDGDAAKGVVEAFRDGWSKR